VQGKLQPGRRRFLAVRARDYVTFCHALGKSPKERIEVLDLLAPRQSIVSSSPVVYTFPEMPDMIRWPYVGFKRADEMLLYKLTEQPVGEEDVGMIAERVEQLPKEIPEKRVKGIYSRMFDKELPDFQLFLPGIGICDAVYPLPECGYGLFEKQISETVYRVDSYAGPDIESWAKVGRWIAPIGLSVSNDSIQDLGTSCSDKINCVLWSPDEQTLWYSTAPVGDGNLGVHLIEGCWDSDIFEVRRADIPDVGVVRKRQYWPFRPKAIRKSAPQKTWEKRHIRSDKVYYEILG
jgi:hypothetical protein